MKLRLPFLMVLGSLFMVGCRADTTSPAAEVPAKDIDLASLPKNIDVQTAAAIMDDENGVMIDVREQSEYDAGHIPGITLIPLSELEARFSEIPTDKTVVLTCRSGNRSGQAHAFLQQNGYQNTINMDGGILAWEAVGFDVER